MELDRCKRYVDELLPGLLWAFQLQGWEVDVHYMEELSDREDGYEPGAEIYTSPLYKSATIEVVPELMRTKAMLAEVLRHEVAHILLSDMERHARMARKACPNGRARKVLKDSYFDATEQFVGKIERMFDVGLGLSPLRLARHGRDGRNRTLKEDRP